MRPIILKKNEMIQVKISQTARGIKDPCNCWVKVLVLTKTLCILNTEVA